MKTASWKCQVYVVLLLGLLAGGCQPIFPPTVNITADDYICNRLVEIHLVGINTYEKERWDAVSMTDYWRPGNQLRESASEYTHVIKFGNEQPCSQTLGTKDPIRGKWKDRNAAHLFILANFTKLPDTFSDLPGNADARRLILPALNSKDWGMFRSKIDISIERSGVVALTIPK